MALLWQLLVNGIVNGSLYALLGLGFSLIFATTRIFHFAYGPIFALSASMTHAADIEAERVERQASLTGERRP